MYQASAHIQKCKPMIKNLWSGPVTGTSQHGHCVRHCAKSNARQHHKA